MVNPAFLHQFSTVPGTVPSLCQSLGLCVREDPTSCIVKRGGGDENRMDQFIGHLHRKKRGTSPKLDPIGWFDVFSEANRHPIARRSSEKSSVSDQSSLRSQSFSR